MLKNGLATSQTFISEAFATLISVIFIIQAIEKIVKIYLAAPMTADPAAVLAVRLLAESSTSFSEQDYNALPGRTLPMRLKQLEQVAGGCADSAHQPHRET